jgi:DNA-binding MarR family transcriptional regulator
MSEAIDQDLEPELPLEAELLDIRNPTLPNERYDLQILGSLRRIIRAVDIHSRKLASEHGITVPQLMCILKIDELGSLTIKELSNEIFLNPSTTVGIVDRLEKNGAVTRERSVRDRRKVRIQLTQKGKEILANSPPPLQEKLAQSIDALPKLEKLTIASSLDKLISLMEDSTPDDFEVREIPQEPLLETSSDLHELKTDSEGESKRA